MKFSSKIQGALIKAAQLHRNQTRKDDKNVPFVIHPYAVAFILANYTDEEDVIVAGFLHDVLEDVPDYSADDMKKEFGERVYNIVKEVSEDKDQNDSGRNSKVDWLQRKERYLANLRDDSREALMVCAADKIHNLISMAEAYKIQGEKLWEKFNAPADKKLWFYKEVLQVLKERLDSDIVKELEGVYFQTEKLVSKT